MPLMLQAMVLNTMCTHNIIPNIFGVGYLIYNVAHGIYHEQCSYLVHNLHAF